MFTGLIRYLIHVVAGAIFRAAWTADSLAEVQSFYAGLQPEANRQSVTLTGVRQLADDDPSSPLTIGVAAVRCGP